MKKLISYLPRPLKLFIARIIVFKNLRKQKFDIVKAWQMAESIANFMIK